MGRQELVSVLDPKRIVLGRRRHAGGFAGGWTTGPFQLIAGYFFLDASSPAPPDGAATHGGFAFGATLAGGQVTWALNREQLRLKMGAGLFDFADDPRQSNPALRAPWSRHMDMQNGSICDMGECDLDYRIAMLNAYATVTGITFGLDVMRNFEGYPKSEHKRQQTHGYVLSAAATGGGWRGAYHYAISSNSRSCHCSPKTTGYDGTGQRPRERRTHVGATSKDTNSVWLGPLLRAPPLSGVCTW